MDFFFKPGSIAIYGVSRNPNKEGNNILRNLLPRKDITLYPVNPFAEEILGVRTYRSLLDVEGPVDLAILFTPPERSLKAVEECAQKGVKGIIIESSGFNEVGDWDLFNRVKDLTQKAGIRVWGPNCTGFSDFNAELYPTFAPVYETLDGRDIKKIQGNVSIISQSGMMAGGMMFQIISENLFGMNKMCSVGNKLDITECDLLEYFASDPKTDVIGIYLESFSNGTRFLELVRSITPHKPVVFLKGGLSKSGASAAMSHTGSMTGENKHHLDILRQFGVILVEDFAELRTLLNVLSIFKKYGVPIPRRANIANMVFSGGAGVVMSDQLEKQGNLTMATYSEKTKRKIAECFPEWMVTGQGNPCDSWPAVEQKGLPVIPKIMNAILEDPNVDAMVASTYLVRSESFDFSQEAMFQDVVKKCGKLVFCWILGEYKQFDNARIALKNMGIPLFFSIRSCMETLSKICRYGHFLDTCAEDQK